MRSVWSWAVACSLEDRSPWKAHGGSFGRRPVNRRHASAAQGRQQCSPRPLLASWWKPTAMGGPTPLGVLSVPRSRGASSHDRRPPGRPARRIKGQIPGVGANARRRPGADCRQRLLRGTGRCWASRYRPEDSHVRPPPVYRSRSNCAPAALAALLSNVQSGCSPTSVANAMCRQALLRKQLNVHQLHNHKLVSFANAGRGHGPGMLRA